MRSRGRKSARSHATRTRRIGSGRFGLSANEAGDELELVIPVAHGSGRPFTRLWLAVASANDAALRIDRSPVRVSVEFPATPPVELEPWRVGRGYDLVVPPAIAVPNPSGVTQATVRIRVRWVRGGVVSQAYLEAALLGAAFALE